MQSKTHFCKFFANRTSFTQNRISGTDTGFLSPRLAYIVEGECLCVSEDGNLPLKPGDVWILPAKKSYRSFWTSNPNVTFYFFEYEADFLSLSVKHFSKIENFSNGDLFEKLHNAETDFSRISCFYSILDKVTPHILDGNDVDLSPVLPALDYIKNHYEESVKVKDLAKTCCLCESKFYSEFKRITGSSPIEYKNALKIKKAAEMIRRNETLETICEELHYSSPAFLRRQTLKYFGRTPSELKHSEKTL